MEAQQFTAILSACAKGDRTREPELAEHVYAELRRIASGLLRKELNHSAPMSTGTLVHEAYLRIMGPDPVQVPSRSYFFAAAAQAMRRILVENARRRQTLKRDNGDPVPFEEAHGQRVMSTGEGTEDVLAVDRALDLLAGFDPRQARVVELRFFGGLSVTETAEVLQISEKTVKRDWSVARAWLRDQLEGD